MSRKMKGELSETDNQTDTFDLLYHNEKGKLFQGDSIEWLKSLESESTDLIFADPPYNSRYAPVIPAKAGIHFSSGRQRIPASAGMTAGRLIYVRLRNIGVRKPDSERIAGRIDR